MRRTLGTMFVVVLTTACAGNGLSPPPSGAATSPEISTPTSTLPPVVECPGTGEFEEGGGIADFAGEDSDTGILGPITWSATARCETFAFEFQTTEGAPATSVPEIQIDHLETFQVIRVRMDVSAAVLTDQLVETGLVDRLYVVESLDGDMFVDLHLAAPAAARARITSSPARLSIDLRPGLVPFTGAATVGESTVVVTPSTGATVETVTRFSGYARVPEGALSIVVTRAETLVSQTSGIPTAVTSNWGEFAEDVELPPDDVTVLVGETDPEDGSLDGVTVEVTAG